jgi:hypothetical protein
MSLNRERTGHIIHVRLVARYNALGIPKYTRVNIKEKTRACNLSKE